MNRKTSSKCKFILIYFKHKLYAKCTIVNTFICLVIEYKINSCPTFLLPRK